MTMRPNRPAVLYILNMMLMVESMTTSVYPGSGTNLQGRMFTLSPEGGGGVSLYPPSFNPSSPSPSWTPYTTSYWPWKTTTAATSTLTSTLPPSTPLTSTLPPSTPLTSTLPPSTPLTSTPLTSTLPSSTLPPSTLPPSTPLTSTLPPSTLPPSTPLTSTLPPSTPLTSTPLTSTLPPSTLPPSTPPTTAYPRGGVSVCVRYMVDAYRTWDPIFTLSPESDSRMVLSTYFDGTHETHLLTLGSYYSQVELSFNSNRQLWPSISDGLWTSVCVTVDSRKGVAQVFRGGAMSIRKRLPTQYEWTGAPVIDLSNIEGQLTDVQVWSSCLTTDDVYSYMAWYRPYPAYRGSVLTWFDISYSLRGNALLDEASYVMDGTISQRARLIEKRIEKRKRRLFRKHWDSNH